MSSALSSVTYWRYPNKLSKQHFAYHNIIDIVRALVVTRVIPHHNRRFQIPIFFQDDNDDEELRRKKITKMDDNEQGDE